MKNHPPLRLLLLLVLLPLLFLSACVQVETDASTILAAMCESQPSMPAGQVYLKGAEADETAYADNELIAALFGDGEYPVEFFAVNDFAFRLSAHPLPCEFAVLRCISPQDAYDVAQLCHRRLDRIRLAFLNSPYSDTVEKAQIETRGSYVLFALGEDPTAALEAGRRACRG